MTRCPKCHAENLAAAGRCAKCGAEIDPILHQEHPTCRIKPRLLVLRPAANATDPQVTQRTDCDIGLPAALVVTPTMPPLRLKVVRGLRVGAEYPLYDGRNMIGRGDDRPVDIDLRDQEPRETVWASRHHAVLALVDGVLTAEDLNSTNGTYVNRHRLAPGAKRPLKADDVLQIGTIQLIVSR